MSAKLDHSLEDIIKTGPRRRSQRHSTGRKNPAPVGGIQKAANNNRRAVSNAKQAQSKPAASFGESKILVSNLVCIVLQLSSPVLTPLALRCRREPDQGMFPTGMSTLGHCSNFSYLLFAPSTSAAMVFASHCPVGLPLHSPRLAHHSTCDPIRS